MSTPLQNISTLYRSPIIFSQLYPVFFASLNPCENAFLLSYLLIPLYTHRESRDYVEKSRKGSSIRLLASDTLRICGLQERVHFYVELTNESLLSAQSCGYIDIAASAEISVKSIPQAAFGENFSHKFARLANNFGVHEIYRMLGVTQL